MRSSSTLATLTTLLTLLLTLTTAQQIALPSCALACFASAISNTTCGLTDYYCQCTTGQEAIGAIAIPCLCHSTCTSSDLIAVVQDSNKICESALSASSQTYTPATIGLGACATAGSGSASATGSAASATGTGSAATTGTAASGSGSGSGSGSATGSAAQQTSSSGASLKAVYGEAMLGVAGLVALAL